MAIAGVPYPDMPSMSTAELVDLTQQQLDAEADRQAKLQETSPGDLSQVGQPGVTLIFERKHITALPPEVIALIKDKVERLALSHNPQCQLPTEIVQCDRLRYLNMRWNKLVQFPMAVLQLKKLEILDLSKNQIREIPEEIKSMTSLKFLAIARNQITRLPLSLGEMNSLQKLKFDENPIEFPPAEALGPPEEEMTQAQIAMKDRDGCQRVKQYLRTQKAQAMRAKLRTTSEEDLSESNVETPKPPKRVVTGGRFPIRPSISGIENIADMKPHSPDVTPPPLPNRSHARVASTNAPIVQKRPGIAPLMNKNNDLSRSRSETVSSSTSLRSRRRGFVPQRKVTNELKSVDEAGNRLSVISSENDRSTPVHSRETSSTSSRINGFLSAGEPSSTSGSPSEDLAAKLANARTLSSLPESRDSTLQPSDTIKGLKRLLIVLFQLHQPTRKIASVLKGGSPQKSPLERQVFGANAQVEELERLLHRVEKGLRDGANKLQEAAHALIRTGLHALKSYAAVAVELKRYAAKITKVAEGIYIRSLMYQVCSSITEARNLGAFLGFNVQPSRASRASVSTDTPRASQAYVTRAVTPRQPKPLANDRRMRGATILKSMASNSTIRAMPPPVPLNTSGSRTNTMTSLSASATPRSGESFQPLSSASTSPGVTRSSTMRNTAPEGDNDEQFDQIFLKLKKSVEYAVQVSPNVQADMKRKHHNAQNAGHGRAAHCWASALNKCDVFATNTQALKKRLGVVKVNDPGLRYQRDFWQLCDNFVHSFTDLANQIKTISGQRIDIASVKPVFRNLQRAIKEVSKIIVNSPLYHHAMGGVGRIPEPPPTASLTTPFPPSFTSTSSSFSSNHGSTASSSGTQSGYVTPVPATPLSAALGPAAQATVASTPGPGQTFGGDYFYEPPTPRNVRERHDARDRSIPRDRVDPRDRNERDRNDTMMQQQPSYWRRQQGAP